MGDNRKTAAEIIPERADSKQPNVGLTRWKDAPKGKVLKNDNNEHHFQVRMLIFHIPMTPANYDVAVESERNMQ